MAQTEREDASEGQEVHPSPTSTAAQVEQISAPVCWPMERAHAKEHHAQALDRKLLGMDQMPHTRAGHPLWMGCRKPNTRTRRSSLEIAHSHPEEVLSPC